MSRPGRSLAVGLPANPRARSASRPRRLPAEQPLEGPLDTDFTGRQLRQQRSLAYLPSNPRAGFSPRPVDQQRFNDSSSVASYSSGSTSSDTSASWRRRVGHDEGYASSRTSIEEPVSTPIKARQPTNDLDRLRKSSGSPSRPIVEPAASGDTIWNRVATAASSLTINVSKAWAANISTLAGEETPPGQESRLTKAMKAYHIAKARDPSDLPDWLFEPHERDTRVRRVIFEDYPPGIRMEGVSTPVSQVMQAPKPSITPFSRGDMKDRLRAQRVAKRADKAATRNMI